MTASHTLLQKIFLVSKEDEENVREIYGKSKEDIDGDVSEITEWLKKQHHLPQDCDTGRIERFLLRNKFRLEKTKKKIDAYYTIKAKHTDLLKNVNPTSKQMQDARKSMTWIPLPKLTPTGERVMVFKFDSEKSDCWNVDVCLLYMMVILDIQMSHDYSAFDRFVCDLKNMNFTHLKALKVFRLLSLMNLYLEGFSGRPSGIELIYPPSFIKVLLFIMKLVLPQKLANKITVHTELKTLVNNIPKENLPKEYGGELDLVEVDVVHKDVEEMLLEMKDFIIDNASKISNEELRKKRKD